ncbi:MAG: SH3 domain-containing protein [Cyanobacteria bacterium P01_D01_bin.156]
MSRQHLATKHPLVYTMMNRHRQQNQSLKRLSGLLGVSLMSALFLASSVSAQTVRRIQAPAPYNACNVRSSAGVQHRSIGTYRNGTLVTLLGESGRGWYRIQVGQVVGWMARQCLGL